MDLAKLRRKEGDSLSFDDLNEIMLKAVSRKPNIKKLDDVCDANTTLKSLYGDYGEMIIYIPVLSPYNGHYTCSFIEDDTIYFFDSYGNSPSQLLELIDSMGHVRNKKCLFQDMMDSGMPGYMNQYQYQDHSPKVQDCGRWCLCVLLFREICHQQNNKFDLNEFYIMMSKYKEKYNYKTWDNAATAFTLKFSS